MKSIVSPGLAAAMAAGQRTGAAVGVVHDGDRAQQGAQAGATSFGAKRQANRRGPRVPVEEPDRRSRGEEKRMLFMRSLLGCKSRAVSNRN